MDVEGLRAWSGRLKIKPNIRLDQSYLAGWLMRHGVQSADRHAHLIRATRLSAAAAPKHDRLSALWVDG